jgi:hypothetical protein
MAFRSPSDIPSPRQLSGGERTVGSSPAPAESELERLHDYAQFLRHELNTPLTAAQTALQVLSEDLDELAGEQCRNLVEIARRNIQRLALAMAASEEYLKVRTRDVSPVWQRKTVREMADLALARWLAERKVAISCETALGRLEMVSDPLLLGETTEQILHTLGCVAPEAEVVLRINATRTSEQDVEREGSGEIVWAFHLTVPPGRVLRPVSRATLTGPGEPLQRELDCLAHFTVAPELLERLGARVALRAGTGSLGPAAVLILPRYPEAEVDTGEPVAVGC